MASSSSRADVRARKLRALLAVLGWALLELLPRSSYARELHWRELDVQARLAADGSLHGFVWDAQNGLKDLNDPGETDYAGLIALANDINNAFTGIGNLLSSYVA